MEEGEEMRERKKKREKKTSCFKKNKNEHKRRKKKENKENWQNCRSSESEILLFFPNLLRLFFSFSFASYFKKKKNESYMRSERKQYEFINKVIAKKKKERKREGEKNK